MNVSVILCTFNRCATLNQALESVLASEMPDSTTWEVLVVDNNSTDQTREVVENVRVRYPKKVRYLFEGTQGLSRARNAGIECAQGDVIVFVDDDVIVDRGWLRALTSLFLDGRWSGGGGPVLPRWTQKPPKWLPGPSRYGLAPLAMFDPGLPAGPLQEPPFGANMAFRREMFAKYGGFRTDLGRCGSNMLSNEDTEFGKRLLTGGERLGFEPVAVVYHPVQANRLRRSYFLAWWYDKGRSDIREFGVPPSRWAVAGIPVRFMRRAAAWMFRWLGSANPRKRFAAKLTVWSTLGVMEECYRISHPAKISAIAKSVPSESKWFS